MKKIWFVLLVSYCLLLTACTANDAGVDFDQSYQTFRYQGKRYAISKEEVEEERIQGLEVKFMEFPIAKEEGNTKEVVSVQNLFVTEDDKWAIGIQDRYYEVKTEDDIPLADRIDYKEILENDKREKEEIEGE